MRQFTAIDPDTGEIKYTGHCLDEEFDLQKQIPGVEIVEGRYDPFTQYWKNGKAVNKPAQPSPYHKFDWKSKTWKRDDVEAWAAVRTERNARLAATDWTQLPDVPEVTKEKWAVHRQALRDVTEQKDPYNIVWPTLD